MGVSSVCVPWERPWEYPVCVFHGSVLWEYPVCVSHGSVLGSIQCVCSMGVYCGSIQCVCSMGVYCGSIQCVCPMGASLGVSSVCVPWECTVGVSSVCVPWERPWEYPVCVCSMGVTHPPPPHPPGWLEVMLERRLMQDDNRGLGQPLKDNLLTRSLFRLLVEPVKGNPPVSEYSV